MSIQFAPCLIDQFISCDARDRADYESLDFQGVQTIAAHPREDLFLGDCSNASSARDHFSKLARKANGVSIGMIRLRNVYLASPTGMIIDLDKGLYHWGQTIGWAGAALVRKKLCEDHGALDSGDGSISLSRSKFYDARSYDCLRLTSAAGYSIYGHWLIDVIPRLLLCKEYSGQPRAPFYGARVRPWALAMAEAAGVDISNRVQSTPGELVFAKMVEIPTFIRHGVVLDEVRAVAAWDTLMSGHGLGADGYGSLIYVSRANWGTRTLSNARELETLLESYGFRVVHPESMTLREQVDAFASARLVIGEDGSGMHNTVFAKTYVQLGIISMGRTNFYHASIANAKQHSVRYLAAVEVGSGGSPSWSLPRDVLEGFLDEVGFQRPSRRTHVDEGTAPAWCRAVD